MLRERQQLVQLFEESLSEDGLGLGPGKHQSVEEVVDEDTVDKHHRRQPKRVTDTFTDTGVHADGFVFDVLDKLFRKKRVGGEPTLGKSKRQAREEVLPLERLDHGEHREKLGGGEVLLGLLLGHVGVFLELFGHMLPLGVFVVLVEDVVELLGHMLDLHVVGEGKQVVGD